MYKIILLISIAVFSCSQVNQKYNKPVFSPNILVNIIDSLNTVVHSDTLIWQKISFNPITDSTVISVKSDTLIMRNKRGLPYGPTNCIQFKIKSPQLTTIKISRLDSCYVKMEKTLEKGNYKLQLFDYNSSSGIYVVYFKNDEQVFKEKLILLK